MFALSSMLRTVKILILSVFQLSSGISLLMVCSKGVVLYIILKFFPSYKDFSFENFEINTLEKFQNLSSLITCREKQNIKLIVEKLEIKDESELLEIIDVIRYTKLNLLEFFLNKDFVNSVYDLKKIENILLYTKEAEVIYFLVEYFKVNSLEEINILNIF